MIYIPIGFQCTNATLLKNNTKRSCSFPFDWILSHPKFVFEMLTLLLENNINIKDLVENFFFCCEKRANVNEHEHYYIDDNGFVLYNSKYDVLFPHDTYNIETIDKYIRRFEKLKNIINTKDEELCFIYISPSSTTNGNFTIDGKNVLCDVYFYLSQIYTLIGKYNNNYKIIVFDALNNESTELNKNIILYKLNSCNNWEELLSQINIQLLN